MGAKKGPPGDAVASTCQTAGCRRQAYSGYQHCCKDCAISHGRQHAHGCEERAQIQATAVGGNPVSVKLAEATAGASTPSTPPCVALAQAPQKSALELQTSTQEKQLQILLESQR